MRPVSGVVLLALGLAAGTASGYWFARPQASRPLFTVGASGTASAVERKVLYYRDPSGAPNFSAIPKKDQRGRDYLPVYEDEEVSFEPQKKEPKQSAGGPRRILYYRNPMGLPDTSPVPKKDPMGMDYIPVYEGEDHDDGTTVKVSLDKVQRSGVRTETVQERVIAVPVRAVGTVVRDESRLTVVALRSEGYIEDLFVSKTGEHVDAGQPLFRVYSPEIQKAQIDVLYGAATSQSGPIQRLQNLGVPESHIQKVLASRTNVRTVDWLAPAAGDVIEKKVIKGQRVGPGDELFKIADQTHLWVIADVSEADLPAIKVGTRATVIVRAYMSHPISGEVTFIYPELKAETRTARVRIEVPNPDGRLKIEMYADVVFAVGAGDKPVASVPEDAVIDSGQRQVVLIAKGGGRFEPRPIKVGRRGDGYFEVLEGLTKGEEIVTSATFLIDAESNLKAALQAFAQPEGSK
jgi:Cu(I)/Ag(I) efflux system membrane fusion protein